ncbi:MAG: hypothetical protein CML17_13780 [Pusillimonas sp.]|nr:hypothetical protein [Pusillimonas sp.]
MSERRNIANTIGKIANDISRTSFKPNVARLAGFYIFLIALTAAIGAGFLSYYGLTVYDARQEELAQIKQLLTKSNITETSDITAAIQSAFKATDWFLILKSVLSGIVTVGFFTYSAAWLKKYYDEDVALAREMQRLNADVARATWVIEAIHEVRHEGKGEVPKEWIDAVTRNLFSGNGDRKNLGDGAMAIRALMGFTANASFGPDGPKFEIGRKGAKELAKAEVSEG